MRNRLMLGTLCAAIVAAVLSPSAKASSVDIGPISMTNVADVGGALTGSTSGSIFSIVGGTLNNYELDSASFSFAANFNTTTNAFQSGSFSLNGDLYDNFGSFVKNTTLAGNLTGLNQTNTTLIFNYHITSSDPALAAVGTDGIFQLKIPNAPSGFKLGGDFRAGNSTVDITAVPTPDAMSAGLLLLGGLAIYGARRNAKLN